MKALNNINVIEIRSPIVKAGRIIVAKLMPDDLIAVISLSSENWPKAISAATSTAMGTAKALIHPRFRNKYSNIVPRSSPLPIKRSIALRRN